MRAVTAGTSTRRRRMMRNSARLTPFEHLASAGSAAASGIDLLTVVMHELGHTIGLDDVSATITAHDIMTDTLAAGDRRSPTAMTTAGVAPSLPASTVTSGSSTAAVAVNVSEHSSPAPSSVTASTGGTSSTMELAPVVILEWASTPSRTMIRSSSPWPPTPWDGRLWELVSDRVRGPK